jgi:hypothetical protein
MSGRKIIEIETKEIKVMLDLHVHLIGHQDRKATRDNIRSFLQEAKNRQIRQIGFATMIYIGMTLISTLFERSLRVS